MQQPQLPIRTDVPLPVETREQKDARMNWWREARFGMFIHWGLYSIPAGEWMGLKGHGEWIRDSAEIPVGAYDKFVGHFNPYKFDAKQWVAMAKDAGMKYIVITSKHHDGFALYDSKVSDFDVMATPFKRDILKELAEECRKQGVILCFYHSIMDWHHPDYLPRRPWEAALRPESGADMDKYVRYLHSQVSELLANYGPIGVMWFDGEWESTWNHRYGQALYNLCRTLQPNTIVNNRVDVGRGGMGGMSDAGFAGDYGTPEQEIPATGLPGVDWETCMTMNDHWGYNRNDLSFKSSRELIRNLVDIASKGGNYLLNVGPTSLGEIPHESVVRLKEIGQWMRVYGDSIYGSSPSVFANLPFGRCTVKRRGGKVMVFLHVLDWPANGKLIVPGLGSDPQRVFLVKDGSKVDTHRDGPNLELSVAKGDRNALDTVIGLEFAGEPTIYETPKIVSPTDIFVATLEVTLSAGPGLEVRYTLDGTQPSTNSSLSNGKVRIDRSSVITAQAFHKGKAVSPATVRKFSKVTPQASETVTGASPGLFASVYAGSWDRLPNFSGMQTAVSFVMPTISIQGPMEGEAIGVEARGYIRVPSDDVYVFELTSDDGARMYIGDRLVVDNDGLHSPEAKTGVIALASGCHSVRLEWFNKTGGTALRLRYASSSEGYNDVPAAWLMHGR